MGEDSATAAARSSPPSASPPSSSSSSSTKHVFVIPYGSMGSAPGVSVLVASFTSSLSASSPSVAYHLGARVNQRKTDSKRKHRNRVCRRAWLQRDDESLHDDATSTQQDGATALTADGGSSRSLDRAPQREPGGAEAADKAFVVPEQVEMEGDTTAAGDEQCAAVVARDVSLSISLVGDESDPGSLMPLELCREERAGYPSACYVLMRNRCIYQLSFPAHYSLRSLGLQHTPAVRMRFSSDLSELLEASRKSVKEKSPRSSDQLLQAEGAQFVQRVEHWQERQRMEIDGQTGDDGSEQRGPGSKGEGKEDGGMKVEDKVRKDRPLRASAKLKQQQLEEERRKEEEERQKRRQLKAQQKQQAGSNRAARQAAKKHHAASSSPSSPHERSAAPPSSLSALPSPHGGAVAESSSAVLPVLSSAPRRRGVVLPHHCYGYDWRLVAKVVECVYASLSHSHSSRIDWKQVAAMMSSISAVGPRECRLLWRYAAYVMDDTGCSNRKRLEMEQMDDSDASDIDVDLPSGTAYIGNHAMLSACNTRRRDEDDCYTGWSASCDYALVNVVAIWADKMRPQAAITGAATASSSSTPAVVMPAPLPSSSHDWAFISSVFRTQAGISKSAAFLHNRFAVISRTLFTTDDGSDEQLDREQRAKARQQLLDLLSVKDDVLREVALHGGGRNWERDRTIADRRSARRRGERAETGTRGPEWQQAALATGSARAKKRKEASGDAVEAESKQTANEQCAAAMDVEAKEAGQVGGAGEPQEAAGVAVTAPSAIRSESSELASSQSSSGSASLQFASADDSGDVSTPPSR